MEYLQEEKQSQIFRIFTTGGTGCLPTATKVREEERGIVFEAEVFGKGIKNRHFIEF